MHSLKSIAVALLLLLALPALGTGALAISSRNSSATGYAFDQADKYQAQAIAANACGPSCDRALAFERGCAAYARGASLRGGSEVISSGTGRSGSDAQALAMNECQYAGGVGCTVTVWAGNSK